MLNDRLITLAVLVANIILFVPPIIKIVQRTGRTGWWSLLFFTGPGMIVGLWLLAYCRWPALDSASPQSN
jgi:dipeptide/tripeptide permease